MCFFLMLKFLHWSMVFFVALLMSFGSFLWIYFYFYLFFKCLLKLRAHALQSKLYKFGYTNFLKFRLQSKILKIEPAFEKITKYVFIFVLPTQNFTSFCMHFFINFFLISYPYSSQKFCGEYHFKFINDCHKSV